MLDFETFFLIIAAGFFATYAHLVTAIWISAIGLPKLDLSAAISELTFSDAYHGKAPYLLGTTVVLINGILLALIYSTLVAPLLPGHLFFRGLFWGLILLAISGCFFAPVIMKAGFFMRKVHPKAWITALIVHLEYGAIIGWLCPVVHFS